MSLNLGNDAIEAAHQMRGSGPWQAILASLNEQARVMTNRALEAPAGARDDAIGYARALRDAWMALFAATNASSLNTIEKPGPVKKYAAR